MMESDNKMKIALVYMSDYKNWPMGGMLNYVKNLLPSFYEQKSWNVSLVGSTIDNNLLEPVMVNGIGRDIICYSNVKTKGKLVPNFVTSFISCFLNRKQFKTYDIIYSHTSSTTIALKILFPYKFIVHHQHGLSYKDNTGIIRILNIGYTIAQILADMSFFVASEREVCEHIQQHSLLFGKKHFFSIGSPIDFKYIQSVDSKKNTELIRFLYTGRIDPWKNIGMMIDAYNIFADKTNRNCELVIIGDGPDYDLIKSKIEKLNRQSIKLLGRRNHEQLVRDLKNSDVFLFPSKGEGVSLSMLEAFAAGMPIVGFNVVGVRNLIQNGKTGILVDEMTAASFANGMEKIVEIMGEMRVDCCNFAREFDAENISVKIINLIKKEYNMRNIK